MKTFHSMLTKKMFVCVEYVPKPLHSQPLSSWHKQKLDFHNVIIITTGVLSLSHLPLV